MTLRAEFKSGVKSIINHRVTSKSDSRGARLKGKMFPGISQLPVSVKSVAFNLYQLFSKINTASYSYKLTVINMEAETQKLTNRFIDGP